MVTTNVGETKTNPKSKMGYIFLSNSTIGSIIIKSIALTDSTTNIGIDELCTMSNAIVG